MDKNNKDSDDRVPCLSRLIRSIQRIEGNPDCFGTSGGFCDRHECQWRCYCLTEPKNTCNSVHEGCGDKKQESGNSADRNMASCSLRAICPNTMQTQNTMRVNYA
jgi:hypothetical protein